MVYDVHGAKLAACRLRDVSASGARLELIQDVELPADFLLSCLSMVPFGDGVARCGSAPQSSVHASMKRPSKCRQRFFVRSQFGGEE